MRHPFGTQVADAVKKNISKLFAFCQPLGLDKEHDVLSHTLVDTD